MAKSTSRDDFATGVKVRLAARAGHCCSNPDCRAATSGPQLLEDKSVNVGVASHISSAAPGGPRYDPALTPAARAGIRNGIGLCQTCSKLIDSDENRYPVEILHRWKRVAEQEAHRRIGKAKAQKPEANAERELKRNLKFRDRMHKDFLKSWAEITQNRSLRPAPRIEHPYNRFRHSEVIIHRIEDDVYPKIDERPGISSWFKLELFDFYHAGIKGILSIESGVIQIGDFYAGNKCWAITAYKADFDRTRFKKIGIWKLGLIPFRNIRHYDLNGDEYYNLPHLYCTFNIDGMPYEEFEYAVVGKDEYDWPLNPELQLKEEAVLAQATETEI